MIKLHLYLKDMFTKPNFQSTPLGGKKPIGHSRNKASRYIMVKPESTNGMIQQSKEFAKTRLRCV